MNLGQLQLIHEAAYEKDFVAAANLALAADEIDEQVREVREGMSVLKTLELNLADEGKFIEQAVLLWGNGMFDSRPSTVREVFKAISETTKLLIMGGSSLSKTYSIGVRFYQDWRWQPYDTAVKLAAPSETQLYTNLFSHLCNLHRAAVIPMTDDDSRRVGINETDMKISMMDALPEMCIQGILCKQSQVSAGALRGHKPKPRQQPHPKYGLSTRLRILIDEGSSVSPGAFRDIKTSEASIDGLETVKVVIAFNPEEVASEIVQMAEPEMGWQPEQVDTLYRWKSKKGYDVLRLDAKRFENIVQRKVVYPRMATYDSFMDLLKSGEHSGDYWAKGRGFPPLKDNAWTIVPPGWMQSQRGEPIYTGAIKIVGILDTALGGSDKALLGVGRWGEAAGWTNQDGKIEWFTSRADPELRIKKHVGVLDQLLQLPKSSSTVEIMQEVMGRCKSMGIPPENLVLDRTGNASGVWSHAKKYWGDVLGIDFGVRASDSKVLHEDQMTCYDVYDGMVTELWFAMKRWLDPVVGVLFLHPMIPTSPLYGQITTRRFRNVKGGRVRVEPKHEFRARNHGVSPDEADIFCLFVAWCRERGGVIPGIQEAADTAEDQGFERVSLKNADEPESLGTEAEWVPGRLDAE